MSDTTSATHAAGRGEVFSRQGHPRPRIGHTLRCAACHHFKPASEFRQLARCPQSYCRACERFIDRVSKRRRRELQLNDRGLVAKEVA